MTIKEFILEKAVSFSKYRLEKLIEVGAPNIMIDRQREITTELEGGFIKISGDTELLDVEYVNHTSKTGRGGKHYISFNSETINYFPQAKFGRCIYNATK